MRRWTFGAMVLLLAAAAAEEGGPTQPLCRAAWNGDISEVRTLLARGMKPDIRDEEGQTPLMRAASVVGRPRADERKPVQSDYAGVVKLLLDKGADVNARDRSGRSALLMSVQGAASEYKVIGGDEGLARMLIERGADVNSQDAEGWSPLLRAASLWADQPDLIRYLLANQAAANARLKDGRTALMLAARLGKADRLPLLLSGGADVNAHDNQGGTALMAAAGVQWDEQAVTMVKYLVSKGADLNAIDSKGLTAADRMAQAGYLDRAKLLLDAGTRVADKAVFLTNARNHALVRATAAGSEEEAEALLEQGADPNSRDDAGRTALMIAADNEYSAAKVNLLLRHGAQVNLISAAGDTALMAAVDQYQVDSVQALLDHGADPNAVDRRGNTVLMRAAVSRRNWLKDREPLIRLLLEKRADPRRKNQHGVTALMLMAAEGNPAAGLLLERGVEVDPRDDEGNTALLYAARWFVGGWQRRIGWALLGKGADVNAANQRGETALILAATQYEVEAAELLLEKGANVNARTLGGRTALMQAIDGPKEFDNTKHVVYSPKIAKLLIESGADVNARDAESETALHMALRRGYSDMANVLRAAGAKE